MKIIFKNTNETYVKNKKLITSEVKNIYGTTAEYNPSIIYNNTFVKC